MIYPLFAFLGAFVLFSFELHLGKLLTPRFGGGSEVWLFCLVYFQLVLLAGYGYGHVVSSRLSGRPRKRLHVALLSVTLLISVGWWIKGGNPWLPRLGQGQGSFSDLIQQLALGPTLSLLLLSSTSPLIHKWFNDSEPEQSPFRLYAWSNAGSVVGLLAYPFLFEPYTSNSFQGGFLWWTLLLLLILTLWIPSPLKSSRQVSSYDGEEQKDHGKIIVWIWYSMLGSAIMVGATGILNEQLGSFPLLWAIPLLAYLLSFILIFDARLQLFTVKFRWVWTIVAVASLWGMEFFKGSGINVPVRMVSSSFALVLSVGLLSHGSLYDLRPSPKKATTFLFAVSAGGALGGLLMAWVVPNSLNRLLELDILAILISATLMVSAIRNKWVFSKVHLVCGAALITLSVIHFGNEVRKPGVFIRNTFGILIVQGNRYYRQLYNLRTIHGSVDLRKPLNPLFYYTPGSGFGHAVRIQQARKPSIEMGVIGLGVGSCAGYLRPEDKLTVFEINPEVIRLAGPKSRIFPIINEAKGSTQVYLGDGRLLLEKALKQTQKPLYDLLLVDAFAGDTIPWHLATKEAMGLYLQSLKPDGILAFHVTTPYPIDLMVMRSIRDENIEMAYIWDVVPPEKNSILHQTSSYLLISRSPSCLQDPRMEPYVTHRMKNGRIWSNGKVNPALTKLLAGDLWVDDQNSLTLMLRMRKQLLAP